MSARLYSSRLAGVRGIRCADRSCGTAGVRGMGWPQWLDDMRAGAADGGWWAIFTRPDGVAPPVYRPEDLCTPGATPEQWARCREIARQSQGNLEAWKGGAWYTQIANSPWTKVALIAGISVAALALLRWLKVF